MIAVFEPSDKDTGKELWTVHLPASGHATPMTFVSKKNKKRYVVIAAGGSNKYNDKFLGFIGSLLLAVALEGAGDSGPFSHKKHGPLKLQCVSCHHEAVSGDLAGYPAVKDCKVCHVDMPERKFPTQRVYEASDFVFFSHARHAAAKVECKSCHGEVMQQDTGAASATRKDEVVRRLPQSSKGSRYLYHLS